MRSVPSGTFSMRATTPATPTRYEVCRARILVLGSREATITSIRSPPSTSLTSCFERSCPIASGISVSGKATLSRSGSTGSTSGRRLVATGTSSVSPFVDGMWMLTPGPPRAHPRSAPRRVCSLARQRHLHLQHAVLVRRARLLRSDVGAELDDAAERAVLDLDLLVEAPARLVGAALAGDQQLAAADLERHVLDVDARELGLHDRPGGVVDVVDVDRRREPAPAQAGRALEDVAEQLVDVTAHPLEVGEQITRGAHGFEDRVARGQPRARAMVNARTGPAPRSRG